MQAKLSDEYREHRVETTRICPSMHGLFHSLQMEGVSINCLRYGAEVSIDAGDFEDFYMFEFPVEGHVNLQLGSERHRAEGLVGSAISPGSYVRSTWSENCTQLMLKVERQALQRYLQSLVLRDVSDPIVFKPSLRFDHGAGRALYEHLVFLMQQALIKDGFMTSVHFRKEFSNSILAALIDKFPHSYAEAVRDETSRILPGHILRAYRFIQNNFREDITNEALAENSGVSLRTLYSGFHKFVGMSPQNFLRLQRLEQAKKDLEQPGGNQTVSEVAANCGFTHMGRFSADFRQRFGKSPSEVRRFSKH